MEPQPWAARSIVPAGYRTHRPHAPTLLAQTCAKATAAARGGGTPRAAYLADVEHLPPERLDLFVIGVVEFKQVQVYQLRHVLPELFRRLV